MIEVYHLDEGRERAADLPGKVPCDAWQQASDGPVELPGNRAYVPYPGRSALR